MSCFECSHIEFLSDLMLKISLLVGSQQSQDAIVINVHYRGEIVAFPHVHVCKVVIGDYSSIGDIQIIAASCVITRCVVAHFVVCVVSVERLNG